MYMNNRSIIAHLSKGGNAGNHIDANLYPNLLSNSLFQNRHSAIAGTTNTSFL